MTQLTDSQRSQGTTATRSDELDLNVLIGLSWMGEATADQIRRMWFAGSTPAAVQY